MAELVRSIFEIRYTPILKVLDNKASILDGILDRYDQISGRTSRGLSIKNSEQSTEVFVNVNNAGVSIEDSDYVTNLDVLASKLSLGLTNSLGIKKFIRLGVRFNFFWNDPKLNKVELANILRKKIGYVAPENIKDVEDILYAVGYKKNDNWNIKIGVTSHSKSDLVESDFKNKDLENLSKDGLLFDIDNFFQGFDLFPAKQGFRPGKEPMQNIETLIKNLLSENEKYVDMFISDLQKNK